MKDNIYMIVAAIALVIHLIINWRELTNWQRNENRAGAREFQHFILALLVFFLTDVLWGMFDGLKWPGMLYFDTLMFFLMMSLSVYFWTRFIAAYLSMVGWPRRRLLWTGRIILGTFVVALATNVFTHHFFTVDAQGQYLPGPARQMVFWLLAAFNVYVSLMTLLQLPRTQGALHRRNRMLVILGLVMTAAIIFQLQDPFLPLYGLGALFSCCLLHVFVVEDERIHLYQKELLAHDYQAQLETARAASQAKSLFFSTVSHDIRTPLNAIVGFSELLEDGISDPHERARCIAAIRSSGKLLARLVDDILDLSKLEIGKFEIIPEPTHVPTIAREVIDACEVARAQKGLALRSEIADMPWLSLDPQRIRQLLYNLLSNACKYTDRGTITVRVRWHDGTLELAVSDTGKGISEENIGRILQPFVQVADRNHRDGTGLGLPICQKLATLMGGELQVASKVGVGSTFTVILRNIKTAPAPAKRPEIAKPAESPASKPARVLIVDDSPVNRLVLKAMLAKCGVTDVSTSPDGRAALDFLRTGTKIDIVFSDLWMPEMDGRDLVRAIRADPALAPLPVYLVTADVEARNQAEADGFTGVFLKPIPLNSLQALFS
ncbi:MAG: response regulator [Kiritimatiellae bacterium]|nr:response regulator [Kiritimatiellia bacterium]